MATCLVALVFTVTELKVYRWTAKEFVREEEHEALKERTLELEKQVLEKTMSDKETEYARTKGGKYMKRDDFRQYAANLRGKNTQYKQMKKQMSEIKSEVTVL